MNRGAIIAVARRELRSVARLVVIAFALALLFGLWAYAVTLPADRYLLVSRERIRYGFHLGAFGLGLLLAWLQVEDERRNDTWIGYWLLPLSRGALAAIKAGVGLAGVVVGAGLPALGLALALAFARDRGGPLDVGGSQLLCAGAVLTGALAYFAGWVASLREGARLAGTRLLPIASALLIALGAAGNARTSLVLLGIAVAVTGVTAALVALRPAGRVGPTDVCVAALLTPSLMALVVTGAVFADEVVRHHEPLPPLYEYQAFDRDGRPLRASSATRRDDLLSMSPLDQAAPNTWLPPAALALAGQRAFFDPARRVFATYDPRSGAASGCLGAEGLGAPCAPFDGELLAEIHPAREHAFLVTSRALYRIGDDGSATALRSGDITGAHVLLDDRAEMVLWIDGVVMALDASGNVVASCPAGGARTVEAGLTRASTLALHRVDDDGSESAVTCDAAGAVADVRALDPLPGFDPPRRALVPFAWGALGPAAGAFVASVERRDLPWHAIAAAALASSAIACALGGVRGGWRRGGWRRGGWRTALLSALAALAIGPFFLLALALALPARQVSKLVDFVRA